METITQAEFGRRKGVTKPAVNKAIKLGRIELNESGKIDWETQSHNWDTRINLARYTGDSERHKDAAIERVKKRREEIDNAGASASLPESMLKSLEEGTISQADARTISDIYTARLDKLKYEEKARELIPEAEIKKAWEQIGNSIRSHLLSNASRLSDILATIEADTPTDRRQAIEKILQADAHETLSELSKFKA